MRVLLVIEPSGGGSGRHVIDLARALVQRGHEVSLIYSPTRAEPRFEAEVAALPLHALHRLPMRRACGLWDIGAFLRLRSLILKIGPFDLIHGHSSKAGALARLAAPFGAARVYTPHALVTLNREKRFRRLFGLIESLLARTSSDAVITVSTEETATARRWKFPDNRLYMIPNGVDLPDPADRQAVRAALNLPDDAVVAGFIGRFVDQKDPVRFAAAVRIAAERDPRIRGLMIGGGPLLDQAREAGGDAVRLLTDHDARALLPALDMLVTPSRFEALPYVVLEAALSGLPLLSTAYGGANAVLEAGAQGQALPLDASAEQFADAIIDWADRPRQPVSPAFVQAFSIGRMADETIAVYRKAFTVRHLAGA